VAVFSRMLTQWHVGMGGAVGLVYGSLERVYKRCKVTPEEEDEVFDGIQIMEQAALNEMRGDHGD